MLFSVVYIADFAIDNVSIGTLNCAEARLSAGSECVVAVGN